MIPWERGGRGGNVPYALKTVERTPKRYKLITPRDITSAGGACQRIMQSSMVYLRGLTWSPAVSLYLRMTWGDGRLFGYSSQKTHHLCLRGGLLSSLGRWQMENYLVYTLNNIGIRGSNAGIWDSGPFTVSSIPIQLH